VWHSTGVGANITFFMASPFFGVSRLFRKIKWMQNDEIFLNKMVYTYNMAAQNYNKDFNMQNFNKTYSIKSYKKIVNN
jgi:hypothetical protein